MKQLVCEYCDQEFERPRKRRFCSHSCSGRVSARKAVPSYTGRHERVKRARGFANQFLCVDCGRRARDWSQIKGTTGLDPEHYVPRCVSCHHIYDGQTVLSETQVREIRASEGITQQKLAEIYGVSPSNISKIRHGKSWGQVT